ncbi:DUF4282 domain-containing protein [Prosthecodimorpha staleyi]|uniref:DUF4282 domain-containing protein n=1 Tax=Prosthecodimorpha staleyi TaxID=2840188 RepID=A0A947D1Z5_9HYPH|nr:DUF4282 domain-containing protein [Prosthecodimorpha staleyi]MBT9289300.1 DUF4282 domain-containing protein [Prosthecodimorpha staleyi]
MLNKFLSLDEFVTPSLIKPLYLLGLALIGLSAVLGVLGSLALLISAPAAALFGLLSTVIWSTMAAIGLRIFVELYQAVFRLHDRFVGGHPKDGIPE